MKKVVRIISAVVSIIAIYAIGKEGSKEQLIDEDKLSEWVSKYYDECIDKYKGRKLKKDKNELLDHVKAVSRIACQIFDDLEIESEDKKRRLIIASYFHDIEKISDSDKHATLGAEYVQKNKEEIKNKFRLTDKDIDRIKEMIEFHSKGKYDKKTRQIDAQNKKIRKLVKIIQDADKISKLYR